MSGIIKYLRSVLLGGLPAALGGAGGIKVEEQAPRVATTMYTGDKDVADSGTPEALAASQALTIGVLIQAKSANTGLIRVGNSSDQPIKLLPDDVIVLPFDNLATIFIEVAVDGEGVKYIAA